ncbi:hypothetical protein CIPAW_11G086900 [Carya illinoinensis]|uniref:Uncharacterized protein n=1 Tax=Carya illinoinensis TaxID=32201 RepID=A0A8T1P2L1_CARIL|nr:hypothetical protein CIPAW_11G086900 [Carya illinoinensis]
MLRDISRLNSRIVSLQSQTRTTRSIVTTTTTQKSSISYSVSVRTYSGSPNNHVSSLPEQIKHKQIYSKTGIQRQHIDVGVDISESPDHCQSNQQIECLPSSLHFSQFFLIFQLEKILSAPRKLL